MLILAISRLNLILDCVQSKIRSPGQVLESHITTLESTFVSQPKKGSECLKISKQSLKLGHHHLKTRSQGQILKKCYCYSRSLIYYLIFMKIVLNVYLWRINLNMGKVHPKTWSTVQIYDTRWYHFKGFIYA